MENKDVLTDSPSQDLTYIHDRLVYWAHMEIIKTYNMAIVLQVEAATNDKILALYLDVEGS